MPRVGFICSANLCRSPMAHAIFVAEARGRGLAVDTFSASTWSGFEGETVADEARRTCDRHGTPLVQVSSVHHSTVDVAGATRVFVMATRHLESLREEIKEPLERVCLLGDFDPQQPGSEIADPIGQDSAAFDACYLRLRDCIRHYLDTTSDFSSVQAPDATG